MRDYVPVLATFAAVIAVVAGLYAASALLAGPAPELWRQPFLSGGLAQEHALSRFHVRWYPVTIVFLAFDMEMVFMYPWAVVVAEVGVKAVVEMFLFLGLLLTGVLYAWREGALRWT